MKASSKTSPSPILSHESNHSMPNPPTSPSKISHPPIAHVCDIPGVHGCIFTELEQDETPLLVVRKHWIILVQTGILVLILVWLCLGIFFIGEFAAIPRLMTIITVFMVVMFGLQYVFIEWVNNELDILLLTNRRIISYDQVKFLDRKMSQTTIDNVQEVNASTAGLLWNILHYGNLMVKTASDSAGDTSDFNMTHIPDPIETSRTIHWFIDEYRHSLDE